jgi:cytochrome c553
MRVLMSLLALLALGAAQGSGGAKRSVWDGVYTEMQASRGERQYGRACENCHGADLAGDPVSEIPALSLDSFMTSWNGRNVNDLVVTMKRSMPKDKPGTLSENAYLDLAAYLLQANKFPSGSRELPRASEDLAAITIERRK